MSVSGESNSPEPAIVWKPPIDSASSVKAPDRVPVPCSSFREISNKFPTSRTCAEDAGHGLTCYRLLAVRRAKPVWLSATLDLPNHTNSRRLNE
jgi:hypothetical protein